ncbi:hypothetical protein ABFZ85_11810 [Hyphococcus formosus]|uniref:hypothetical protein n=1 Tax=Hyphococcus formosus TaxID=3143534 RepID=UPI00398B076A
MKTHPIAVCRPMGLVFLAAMKGYVMKPFLIAATSIAMATSTMAQQPRPTCDAPIYSAFDFWLGDWVVTANDQPAGKNTISKQENGCLLLEQWTSVNGSTGQSYNFVDPARENWRQVWVSAGAVIDIEGGLDESGAMRLEGTITTRTGDQAPFDGVWTLRDDGNVKQHFRQFNPETDQWDDWFIGIYRKASD